MMAKQKPALVCGKCGYAVRGASTVNCPECGANLTEVGIVSSGMSAKASIATKLIVLIGYSFAVLVVASVLFSVLVGIVPNYYEQSTSMSFRPASKEYSEAEVTIAMTVVHPAGTSGSGFSMQLSPGKTKKSEVTLAAPGSKLTINDIMLYVRSKSTATGISTNHTPLVIDPKTKQATWTDSNQQEQTTSGPLTDQDVLTYLGESGADTKRPEVQMEAQQLFAMLDGTLDGYTKHTLNGFGNAGYSSGGSYNIGPPWYIPTYIISWVVIWIIGLVLVFRRLNKKLKQT